MIEENCVSFAEEYEFYVPVRLLCGKGVIEKNSSLLSSLGKRCVLVTGRHSALSCGARQDVEASLKKEGISWAVYNGIGENPLLESCREAARLCKREKADFVIGIGGGSPMDAAKAAAVLAADPELSEKALFEKEWPKSPLPIVLVGTTSGTGSEISAVSVLTCPDGRKRSISGRELYPTLSFGDSRYTYSLPLDSLISTGLDAFAHAAEGYLSPKCGGTTALFAEAAIPALWMALSALYKGEPPTENMHDRLYEASLWAGFVLAANGASFPHPYGYVLTERYKIPHGKACAAFFPVLFSHAEKTAPEKTQRFLTLCGCGRDELLTCIYDLSGVESLRMDEAEIEGLRERFRGLKHYKNVPGGYDEEKGLAIFRELFAKSPEKEGGITL